MNCTRTVSRKMFCCKNNCRLKVYYFKRILLSLKVITRQLKHVPCEIIFICFHGIMWNIIKNISCVCHLVGNQSCWDIMVSFAYYFAKQYCNKIVMSKFFLCWIMYYWYQTFITFIHTAMLYRHKNNCTI